MGGVCATAVAAADWAAADCGGKAQTRARASGTENEAAKTRMAGFLSENVAQRIVSRASGFGNAQTRRSKPTGPIARLRESALRPAAGAQDRSPPFHPGPESDGAAAIAQAGPLPVIAAPDPRWGAPGCPSAATPGKHCYAFHP